MNKAIKEKTAPDVRVGETVSANHSTVKWGDQELSLHDLPAHAVHYLVQYGMNQSRSDAVAGLRKGHVDKGISEEESKAEYQIAWAKRLGRILDGTITTRVVGPRKIGIDRFMKDVAADNIRAACAKKRVRVPVGKAMNHRVEEYIRAWPDLVRRSAELRMQEAEMAADA